MPARIGRLKQRSEFLKVAAARRKWVAPGLILQARQDEGKDTLGADPRPAGKFDLRLGFTVSKKVGNAVQRNRARRRLRAIAGDIMGRHAAAHVDYVLIGRRDTLARPFPALCDDLRTALRGMKLWRREAIPS
jgi:ribonuclease P protein component